MGRWTYYSPLLIGVIGVLLINDSLRAGLPTMEPWLQWVFVAIAAVNVALACQVLLIGAQGAFAQVLPVPRGRSIRGSAAVAGGWLLIAWITLGFVARLLYGEDVMLAAYILGGASLAAFIAFAIVYIWNIPVAAKDFDTEKYRLD